jgi:hypothetical protein
VQNMSNTARVNALFERVVEVLASEGFRGLGAGYDRIPLIGIADALGGPPMRLLHWERLAELRRIPRSNEGYAINATEGIDAYGAPIVEVFMVSHRWLRPSLDPAQAHPDGPDNEKARAINEFSNWRRQWVRRHHDFLPEIYYWIDYSCINQDDTSEAVPLLPLWTACCERFLRVETEDYDERAWCRVEPLLSYVFSFADHHIAIGPEFRDHWPYQGEEVNRPILDPREGKLTDTGDMEMIRRLVETAAWHRPANSSRMKVELNATSVKCYKL